MKNRKLITIGAVACVIVLVFVSIIAIFPKIFGEHSEYYSWVDFVPFAQWDPYYDLRPQNQDFSRWVCEDPKIYFEVKDDDWIDKPGKMILNDEEIDVFISFNRGKGITIDDGNAHCVRGYCKFEKDYFKVWIDTEERARDDLLFGKYEELIFRKLPIE